MSTNGAFGFHKNGIDKVGEYPWKLYGVTYDGNRNEVEIFISAFATEKEALEYPLNYEFHSRWVEVEEDF